MVLEARYVWVSMDVWDARASQTSQTSLKFVGAKMVHTLHDPTTSRASQTFQAVLASQTCLIF